MTSYHIARWELHVMTESKRISGTVYVYMYVYTYMYVYVSVSVYISVYIYVYICISYILEVGPRHTASFGWAADRADRREDVLEFHISAL